MTKRRGPFPQALKRTRPHFTAERVGLEIGGRDRDRTCDLIHAMDALSQLSYTPLYQTTKTPATALLVITCGL
jgi:hypothetical protein